MIKVWTNRKNEKFNIEYDEYDKDIIDMGVYVKSSDKYHSVYVQEKVKKNKKSNTRILARILLGVDDPSIFVDHIDRNPLNNKRNNLRIATPKQNSANIFHKTKTNGYVNVIEKEDEKRFFTTIPEDRKSFDNNYDAIIHVYNYHRSKKGEYNPETRTLVEIALDIPYKTYSRTIYNKVEGNMCDKCNKLIKSSFNEHYEKCTNLTCTNCETVFSSLGKLQRHKKENCSDKICVRCEGIFKNKKDLGAHVKTCNYICDKCNYNCPSQSNMGRHKRDYHTTNENDGIDFYREDLKIFECKVCDFKSETQAGIYMHKYRKHRGV